MGEIEVSLIITGTNVGSLRVVRQSLVWILASVLSLSVTQVAAASSAYRVAVLLDKGGKDDKSFNAAAFKGTQEAVKKLGVKVKVLEGRDDNSAEPMLRSLASKRFDLIFAIGFSQAEAVKKVAAQFPDRHFVLVDSEIQAPNVASVLFQEHEIGYLVGAMAGLTTKSGKVGFIGGMDIPLIRRFLMGYEAGVKSQRPKDKITINFTGVTGEAWNNPPKGKELAISQYDQGVDVVFAAAGATNMGVFDAAEERGKLAIGCDSNQNWVKPGFVLSSALKRVDNAVYRMIEDGQKGVFHNGTVRYGLADGGVDFALDDHNAKLLAPAVLAKLAKIKSDIVAGKVKVPDYYVVAKSK
ncbi:MAG: hypothetical protein RL011_963 [Pseudomonadota bacterium]